MQSSLPQDLVPLGSSTLLAVISTSCSIFMAIGQAVFQRQLLVNLSGVIPSRLVQDLIDSGVTSVSSHVDAPELVAVIEKYSLSVTQVFNIPAVTPVISFFLLLDCKKSKKAPETVTALDEKIESDAEKGVLSSAGDKLQPEE
ncbi:hypothetical protein B0I37DRAFT_357300 [Chaetomium sp. MPI-CAGE-AT-0009]|nr:hypothetical protein B0I37DRAFT_357300 [Chaetomium sp. MPI-CAGE-AT-0009]